MSIKSNAIKQNKEAKKYSNKNKKIIKTLLYITGIFSLCIVSLSFIFSSGNKGLDILANKDHSDKYNPSPDYLIKMNNTCKDMFNECNIDLTGVEINGLAKDKTTIDVNQDFDKYIEQMTDQHIAISQLLKDFGLFDSTYFVEGYLVPKIDMYNINAPLEKIHRPIEYVSNNNNGMSIQDLKDKSKEKSLVTFISLPGEYYRMENTLETCVLNVTCQYLLRYYPKFADKYKFRKIDKLKYGTGLKDVLNLNQRHFKKYQEDIQYNAMQALKFAEDIGASHSYSPLYYIVKYLETQTQMTEEEKKKELARFVSHCISVQANKEEKGHLIYRINKNTVISDDGVMLMPLRAPIYTLQNITGIIIQILLSSKKNSKDIYVLSQNLLNDPNSQELTKCIANNIIKIAHE